MEGVLFIHRLFAARHCFEDRDTAGTQVSGLCSPSASPQGRFSWHYPHFPSEEAEARRGYLTCPRSHSR